MMDELLEGLFGGSRRLQKSLEEYMKHRNVSNDARYEAQCIPIPEQTVKHGIPCSVPYVLCEINVPSGGYPKVLHSMVMTPKAVLDSSTHNRFAQGRSDRDPEHISLVACHATNPIHIEGADG